MGKDTLINTRAVRALRGGLRELPFVLMGGALRDALLGREVRDLDVVVAFEDKYEALDTLFTDQRGLLRCYGNGDDHYEHAYIHAQGEAYSQKIDRTVNLIVWREGVTPTVEKVADINNFGLCQIATDGEQVYASDNFGRDRRDQMHTLTRTGWGVAGSMNHFVRLHKKYPWPVREGN